MIIPTYNRGHLIERAIRSVARQTCSVLEIIVVDDGSSDDTRDVLLRLAEDEPRLVLLSQDRGGAPAARNRGIRAARGSLIAFQDSDDVWKPTFVEELLRYHSRGGIVAFTSMIKVDPQDGEVVDFPDLITDVPATLIRTNCISTQTALVDAQLLKRQGFDESLPRLQDWDLWLSLMGKAAFVHHPQPLVIQYLQGDSITAGSTNLYIALRRITTKHRRLMARSPRTFVKLWLASRVHTTRTRALPGGRSPSRRGAGQEDNTKKGAPS